MQYPLYVLLLIHNNSAGEYSFTQQIYVRLIKQMKERT